MNIDTSKLRLSRKRLKARLLRGASALRFSGRRRNGAETLLLIGVMLIGGLAGASMARAEDFKVQIVGITVTADNPADMPAANTFYLGSFVRIECRYRWLANSPDPGLLKEEILMQFFHKPAPSYVNYQAQTMHAAPPGVVLSAKAGHYFKQTGDSQESCAVHRHPKNAKYTSILASAKTTIKVVPRPPRPGPLPTPVQRPPLGKLDALRRPSDPDPIGQPRQRATNPSLPAVQSPEPPNSDQNPGPPVSPPARTRTARDARDAAPALPPANVTCRVALTGGGWGNIWRIYAKSSALLPANTVLQWRVERVVTTLNEHVQPIKEVNWIDGQDVLEQPLGHNAEVEIAKLPFVNSTIFRRCRILVRGETR